MGNLIERFGGYKKTKEYLKENSCFMSFEALEGFYDALLEYRRQHNIYEVGDVIIHVDFKCVGRFSKYTGKTGTLCYIGFGLGELTALIKHIRHATPEEIEVGRRL